MRFKTESCILVISRKKQIFLSLYRPPTSQGQSYIKKIPFLELTYIKSLLISRLGVSFTNQYPLLFFPRILQLYPDDVSNYVFLQKSPG